MYNLSNLSSDTSHNISCNFINISSISNFIWHVWKTSNWFQQLSLYLAYQRILASLLLELTPRNRRKGILSTGMCEGNGNINWLHDCDSGKKYRKMNYRFHSIEEAGGEQSSWNWGTRKKLLLEFFKKIGTFRKRNGRGGEKKKGRKKKNQERETFGDREGRGQADESGKEGEGEIRYTQRVEARETRRKAGEMNTLNS